MAGVLIQRLRGRRDGVFISAPVTLPAILTDTTMLANDSLPHRRARRRRHRPRGHGAGARRAAQDRGDDARAEIPLHRSAGRRRTLSRHRQVDAGEHDEAVRRGRRHPARRLRAAGGALSRRHRDHAAGRTALHLRPLCRRAAVPAHSRRAEPDRRRGRARHRSRGDPRIRPKACSPPWARAWSRTTRRARRC